MIIKSIDIHTNNVKQLQNQFIYDESDVLGDRIKTTDVTQVNPYQPNNIVITNITPTRKDFILSGNDIFQGTLQASTEGQYTELRMNFRTDSNCKDNNLPDDDKPENGEIIVKKGDNEIERPIDLPEVKVELKKIIKIISPFGIIVLKK
jgi:hypothetical protein